MSKLHLAVIVCSVALACSSEPKQAGPDLASARIAITQAPSDVACLRITVAGSRTTTRAFDVKPSQSTVFVLNGLPDGDAVFLADAFPQACSFVGTSSSATWVSDPVQAKLARGKTIDVHLVMHGNAGADVKVDFPDGGTPDAGGQAQPSPSPVPDPFLLGEPTFPSVHTGPDAVARLSTDRQGLLDQLRMASKGPVSLTVDDKTGIVLTLDLRLANLPGQSPKERARAFLDDWEALLDPLLDSAELVASTDPGCEMVAAVFDRYVSDLPVLGSRMTFQFDADGTLVQVVNGVAPAPSTVSSIPSAPIGGRPLPELVPGYVAPSALQRHPILIPQPDGSGLLHADLVAWPSPTQGFQGAIAIGDVAMGTSGTLVVKGNGKSGFRPGLPAFHGPGTVANVPDFVSYRMVQGTPANMLPGERNPVEVGYRFLEDHPALFHSGAARCQFSAGGIVESASLPGAVSVRMDQRYAGVPVYGAQVLFNLEGTNHVMAAGGHILPSIDVPVTPSITGAAAVSAAQSAVRATALGVPALDAWGRDLLAGPASASLAVYPGSLSTNRQKKGETRLAWNVQMSDVTMLVDAQTGEILFSNTARSAHNVIMDGQGQNEFGRLSYVTVDVDGVLTGALPPNTDVLPARAGMSATAAAYAGLGWLGLNGSGSDFHANTNVNVSSGCLNAFFTSIIDEGFFCLGMGGDDVIGHEFTHGVIGRSSGLVYQDEPGALNESLADLMGNLIFPDATPTSWLVGEREASGALRDMANPGAFGQPSTMAGYVPRDSTCNAFPWSCDSGFVHTNSGITNRAFVLLTDGIAGLTTGIGRAKMIRLAFLTLTQRLTPWSHLNDVPLAMRDACDALVARGGTGIDGTPFAQPDCDQIPVAFNQVGLNPALIAGWSEPDLAFDDTDTFFANGQTTPTGCNVANVTASLNTLSGALTADLDPATATPSSVSWLGLQRLDMVVPGGAPPAPIGTTSQTFRVHWFNAFGGRPNYTPQVVVSPPPAGFADCISAAGSIPVERVSASIFHPLEVGTLFGASGTDAIGNAASGIDPRCTLNNTFVEIVNDNGDGTMSGPGLSVAVDHPVDCFFFTLHFFRRASLLAPPPGGTNLSAPVGWSYDTGQQVRFRLRYYLDKPNVVADCVP